MHNNHGILCRPVPSLSRSSSRMLTSAHQLPSMIPSHQSFRLLAPFLLLKLLLKQKTMKSLRSGNVEMKMLESVCVETHATPSCFLRHMIAKRRFEALMKKIFFIANRIFRFKIFTRSNAMPIPLTNLFLLMALIIQKTHQ